MSEVEHSDAETMKPTIYFLTKAAGQQLGGQIIREAQVAYLRQRGYRVRVVAPAIGAAAISGDRDAILVPVRMPLRVSNLLEHVGLVDDYLHEWAKSTIAVLEPIVRRGDMVFASSGGELSCLRVGWALKGLKGCRYVANLHDPITYSSLDGVRPGRALHVSRDRWEREYLGNADLILTSTRSHATALCKKHPQFRARTRQMYFGYTMKLSLADRALSSKVTVAYGGTFRKTQRPERLAEVAATRPGVRVAFVGAHGRYRPLNRYRAQVDCLPPMNQHDYNRFLVQEVDVGFVSLADERFRHCVPSKIFEYINAGLPILAALPPGEAAALVNDSGYGIARDFCDTDGLSRALDELSDPRAWTRYREAILRDRDAWSLEARMDRVIEEVLGLVSE